MAANMKSHAQMHDSIARHASPEKHNKASPINIGWCGSMDTAAMLPVSTVQALTANALQSPLLDRSLCWFGHATCSNAFAAAKKGWQLPTFI